MGPFTLQAKHRLPDCTCLAKLVIQRSPWLAVPCDIPLSCLSPGKHTCSEGTWALSSPQPVHVGASETQTLQEKGALLTVFVQQPTKQCLNLGPSDLKTASNYNNSNNNNTGLLKFMQLRAAADLIASGRIKEPSGYIILCCTSSIFSVAGLVLLATSTCTSGTESCGRPHCWKYYSGGHIYVVPGSLPAKGWAKAAALGCARQDRAGGSMGSICSRSAPWYGACFFSTLKGCDKPLQGTLNHPMEDA